MTPRSFKKAYLLKVRHILPAFLLISGVTVGGLAFFRWLFAIRFEIIDIKEDFWEFWIPFLLPWLPVLRWLKPKFRLLNFKDEDRGQFGFQLIAAGTLTVCLMVSQAYLTTATGKLQQVKTAPQIGETAKARYYTIADFEVAALVGRHVDFRTSGKYNQDLNFTIYLAFLFAPPATPEPANATFPREWYGLKYRKQISNRLSGPEKEAEFLKFSDECLEDLRKKDFSRVTYFERLPNSDARDGYLKAIKSAAPIPPGLVLTILEPRHEPFAARNGKKLPWIFYTYGLGLGLLLFCLIWPKVSQRELIRLKTGQPLPPDSTQKYLAYLIPKGDHFATSVILDLNLLVFLLMFFAGVSFLSPTGPELLDWGGNRRFETTHGEWWRLFTSLFVHGGVMHLLMNVYGLVIAAVFIEPILGRKHFFILYLAAGLVGSLCSIWWNAHVISVGASGAIFGLHGGLLALLLTKAIPQEGRRLVLTLIGVFVAGNVVFGFAVSGIDNAAHLGGLFSGAFLATGLYAVKEKEESSFAAKEENP